MSTTGTDSTSPESPGQLHRILTDAIRFWELRRIPYNIVLVLVVTSYSAVIWAHYPLHINWQVILALFVLAVLANVCYCAAYMADVPMQWSGFRAAWLKRRWLLWLLGTLFACVLALFWMADEILPGMIS